MLLAAVVAVWGVVVWRIFSPPPSRQLSALPSPASVIPSTPEADTLQLDYLDPFLKKLASQTLSTLRTVQVLPALKPIPPRRERMRLTHVATVTARQKLYILTIGDQQYELSRGEQADGFTLTDCDCDSLYFCKGGITYGIKLCE